MTQDKGNFWIVIGDVHGEISNISKIPAADQAEAIIINGDITNRGHKELADRILNEVQKINTNIYAHIGNMDSPEIEGLLQDKGWNIHARGVQLGQSIGLMGVGRSNPTPFGTPSEVQDEELSQWLKKAFEDIQHLEHKLVVTHAPPINTGMDRAGGGAHAGSQAVRDFIEHYQPDICISGHIHEAIGEEFLGRTKLLNPGMFSSGRYILVSETSQGVDASLKSI